MPSWDAGVSPPASIRVLQQVRRVPFPGVGTHVRGPHSGHGALVHHECMGERRNTRLGSFLRARRAWLSPEDVGFETYGSRRRVSGLRREEIAHLAGISSHYYTRIEQGENHQLSHSVLEAIADALRLDGSGRVHLQNLARPVQAVQGDEAGPETVRDTVTALAESITDRAVHIVGHRMDLLGGNRLGFALLDLHPDQRPNMARHMFLVSATRDLFTDWEQEAHRMAAYLRMASGQHPNDPLLEELVSELGAGSKDFARIWAAHPVAECGHATLKLRHPLVGHLSVQLDRLIVADAPNQQVVAYSACPGSESAERLKLLNALVSRPGVPEGPRDTA
ncbi:helix-turn-helix transcriptional regulator [Streptomyces sp. NPDC096354]|uniref:helix-turn-helix transcriptional regulator n=1 Tax=Streptomyces sp. NPDC096354 TaxID=3366088 RepID=UPI0038061A93